MPSLLMQIRKCYNINVKLCICVRQINLFRARKDFGVMSYAIVRNEKLTRSQANRNMCS